MLHDAFSVRPQISGITDCIHESLDALNHSFENATKSCSLAITRLAIETILHMVQIANTNDRQISENISILVHGLLHPISLKPLEPQTSAECNPNQIPVILVHGFLGTASGWSFMQQKMSEAGLKNVFSVELGNPLDSIDDYTSVLREKVRSVCALTGKNTVILVGHSMGGLVCRQYQQQYASVDKKDVRSIITIASPLAGTQIAHKASWISRSAEQMLPNSPFIQRQKRWQRRPNRTKYTHIVSDVDPVVRESLANGSYDHSLKRVHGVGHTAMLLSERVCNLVVHAILPISQSQSTMPTSQNSLTVRPPSRTI